MPKRKAAKSKNVKTPYSYRSKEHRDWAAQVKLDGDGCIVCGRGKRPRRKGQRLHSHHVHGTDCKRGVVLCPTHHELLTLLTGRARDYWERPGIKRRLNKLVRERLKGCDETCS